MVYEVFDRPTDEMRALRVEVFLVEQGFKVEFDDLDEPGRAVHLIFYEGNAPAAVCRIYPTDTAGEWAIGRVAVKRRFRGGGRGREVMLAAERECIARGAVKASLSAQVQAQGFYASCGYSAEGDTYLDEHCPHIHMTKTL